MDNHDEVGHLLVGFGGKLTVFRMKILKKRGSWSHSAHQEARRQACIPGTKKTDKCHEDSIHAHAIAATNLSCVGSTRGGCSPL
jgi:hypothetical protein